MKSILFLCTGNYYRSRFAEEIFNHHARLAGIRWSAFSRALAIERGESNSGPCSPTALRALSERGVVVMGGGRAPQQCTTVDLESADLIVALMQAEHYPLMQERFPQWRDQTEYWDVGDIGMMLPGAAMTAIEANVRALIERMAAS